MSLSASFFEGFRIGIGQPLSIEYSGYLPLH